MLDAKERMELEDKVAHCFGEESTGVFFSPVFRALEPGCSICALRPEMSRVEESSM